MSVVAQVKADLIRQWIRRDDAFWGVHPTAEDGTPCADEESYELQFKSGWAACCCTGYAVEIRERIGRDRVTVAGFGSDRNPGSWIAATCGGHDFAVFDRVWIIDPWLTDVEGQDLPGVWNLIEDRAEVLRLYGPSSAWEFLNPAYSLRE